MRREKWFDTRCPINNGRLNNHGDLNKWSALRFFYSVECQSLESLESLGWVKWCFESCSKALLCILSIIHTILFIDKVTQGQVNTML